MTQWQDTSNYQDNIYSMWLTNSASNKHETCDILLNDCDDACTTVHTTSCVSVIDVYMVNTTQTQPSTSPKWGCKQDIVINMLKQKLVEQVEKKKVTFMFSYMHVIEDKMIWQWQAILQTQLRGVLQMVFLTYHTYPQDDHASDGVCMWSWSFPWLSSLLLLLNSLEEISTCYLFL